MDIIIQSIGFKSGETLETFIQEKVKGLKNSFIIRANVTLFMGSENSPEKNFCEIRLEIPGNDHFVKKNSHHFETSVSECIDVLSQMLNKDKDKNVDKRQANANEVQDSLIAGTDDDDEVELEDIVR